MKKLIVAAVGLLSCALAVAEGITYEYTYEDYYNADGTKTWRIVKTPRPAVYDRTPIKSDDEPIPSPLEMQVVSKQGSVTIYYCPRNFKHYTCIEGQGCRNRGF